MPELRPKRGSPQSLFGVPSPNAENASHKRPSAWQPFNYWLQQLFQPPKTARSNRPALFRKRGSISSTKLTFNCRTDCSFRFAQPEMANLPMNTGRSQEFWQLVLMIGRHTQAVRPIVRLLRVVKFYGIFLASPPKLLVSGWPNRLREVGHCAGPR